MDKINKIDLFYEKLNGSYIAFFSLCFAIFFVSITVLLYLPVDPSFSVFTHYISELGGTSEIASVVFNVGMIISGPLRIGFLLFLMRFLQKSGAGGKISWSAFVIGTMSAIGSMTLSIFPENVSLPLHMLGAAIYFFGAVILQILIAKMELRLNMPRYLPISAIAVTGLYLTFFITMIIFERVPGLGGFSVISVFLEWMGFVALMVWLLVHGLYTYQQKKNFS